MKRFSIALALSAFVISLAITPAVAQSAADNYKARCQMCHGATGAGDAPMGKKLNVHDFHSDVVQKKSDGELFTIIRDGVTTSGKVTMPSSKGKLNDDQIHDLVKYVRELGKK